MADFRVRLLWIIQPDRSREPIDVGRCDVPIYPNRLACLPGILRPDDAAWSTRWFCMAEDLPIALGQLPGPTNLAWVEPGRIADLILKRNSGRRLLVGVRHAMPLPPILRRGTPPDRRR